jgi:methylated-DNA-[protein]-cysteine S-methyltransferase
VKNEKAISPAAVYDTLTRIPSGKLTTYGDIAIMLGRPGASRAIGRILNMNPNPVKVPCHRVVMSDGNIGGYAFGKARKKELLESEGIYFDGDSVVEFKKCRVDSSSLI